MKRNHPILFRDLARIESQKTTRRFWMVGFGLVLPVYVVVRMSGFIQSTDQVLQGIWSSASYSLAISDSFQLERSLEGVRKNFEIAYTKIDEFEMDTTSIQSTPKRTWGLAGAGLQSFSQIQWAVSGTQQSGQDRASSKLYWRLVWEPLPFVVLSRFYALQAFEGGRSFQLTVARSLPLINLGVELLLFITLLLLSQWFLHQALKRTVSKLVDPVEQLNRALQASDGPIVLPEVEIDEIQRLGTTLTDYERKMAESNGRLKTLEVEGEKAKIAAQVAHDIRSPLAALEMVLNHLPQMPEERRVLIRGAVARIRDIANSLLQKKRAVDQQSVASATSAFSLEPRSKVLVSALVESLLSEKRIQYRSDFGITIEGPDGTSSYGLFVELQANELKRVLSNLINNAVEAFEQPGLVQVLLNRVGDYIELKVVDNGKGMEPDVLEQVTARGGSHGKEGGNGLGLKHARSSVQLWGGQFQIESQPGKGTTVSMRFFAAEPPEWFLEKLVIAPALQIFVLDDDPSVHGIWQQQLGLSQFCEQGVQLVHCSTGQEFEQRWLKTEEAAVISKIALVDYELIDQGETGLDVIERLQISHQATLVTSRFEEPQVLSRCQQLGVKMLPKSLAGFIPIEVSSWNQVVKE